MVCLVSVRPAANSFFVPVARTMLLTAILIERAKRSLAVLLKKFLIFPDMLIVVHPLPVFLACANSIVSLEDAIYSEKFFPMECGKNFDEVIL